jgi:hypothetical protein
MPYKTEKIKLGDPFLDRRTKLLPCQREMVHYWHTRGVSINAIARMFKVHKRLIQFELFPERKKLNLQHRKNRGGTMVYYKKEKHTAAIREHRHYKYNTLKDTTMIEIPQDRAKSLYQQYLHILGISNDMRPGANPFAKECALFCAEECRKAAFSNQEWESYWVQVVEAVKQL